MLLEEWKLEFKPGWDVHFKKFDKATQQRILKKLNQMKHALKERGLHSLNYHVEETGQYRIAFINDEEAIARFIHFIGNHKQYEEWYKKQ